MDEGAELYDEFGNYIGDSDSEDSDVAVDAEEEAEDLGEEGLEQVGVQAGHGRVELHAQEVANRSEEGGEEALGGRGEE